MSMNTESNREETDIRNPPDIRVLAPWERVFDKFTTPLEHFVRQESAGGILLLVCLVLALLFANSPLAATYHHLLATPIQIGWGDWILVKTLQHWINEGLMTLFFFVVGLEIKREILVGELSDMRQAVLPVIAAIAGMVVPAILYCMVVPAADARKGWGIPMATDIAFALGALLLLGSRIPKSMVTLLLAIAIVDDLGALLVIALVYTRGLHVPSLTGALGVVLILVLFNRLGVRRPSPYLVAGMLLWLTLLHSGVHATLAGVLTAFTIPAIPKYQPTRFAHLFDRLVSRYRDAADSTGNLLRNERLRSVLQTMENAVRGVMPPLQRFQYKLNRPVAVLVVPLFALANAGVALDGATLAQMLVHPVAQGVALGLLVGKVAGITLVTWMFVRAGWVRLPRHLGMTHVIGVALLAGIGFTMSIFIADLAFGQSPVYLAAAKSGVLFASLIAATLGLLWIRLVLPRIEYAW